MGDKDLSEGVKNPLWVLNIYGEGSAGKGRTNSPNGKRVGTSVHELDG